MSSSLALRAPSQSSPLDIPELLTHIIGQVDAPEDLISCMQVNRFWRTATNKALPSPVVQKTLVDRLRSHRLQTMAQCPSPPAWEFWLAAMLSPPLLRNTAGATFPGISLVSRGISPGLWSLSMGLKGPRHPLVIQSRVLQGADHVSVPLTGVFEGLRRLVNLQPRFGKLRWGASDQGLLQHQGLNRRSFPRGWIQFTPERVVVTHGQRQRTYNIPGVIDVAVSGEACSWATMRRVVGGGTLLEVRNMGARQDALPQPLTLPYRPSFIALDTHGSTIYVAHGSSVTAYVIAQRPAVDRFHNHAIAAEFPVRHTFGSSKQKVIGLAVSPESDAMAVAIQPDTADGTAPNPYIIVRPLGLGDDEVIINVVDALAHAQLGGDVPLEANAARALPLRLSFLDGRRLRIEGPQSYVTVSVREPVS